MEINKVFCLFEQSGTFKNEFKKLGIDAEDFDILNEYGETDRQIDLFKEIDKAFEGEESIFDDVKPEDLILAFYPCTRFECQAHLLYRGESAQMANWTDEQKLIYSMKCHEELHALYMRLCKLCLSGIRGGGN